MLEFTEALQVMIEGNERVGLNEFFCLNQKMLMRDQDRELRRSPLVCPGVSILERQI